MQLAVGINEGCIRWLAIGDAVGANAMEGMTVMAEETEQGVGLLGCQSFVCLDGGQVAQVH